TVLGHPARVRLSNGYSFPVAPDRRAPQPDYRPAGYLGICCGDNPRKPATSGVMRTGQASGVHAPTPWLLGRRCRQGPAPRFAARRSTIGAFGQAGDAPIFRQGLLLGHLEFDERGVCWGTDTTGMGRSRQEGRLLLGHVVSGVTGSGAA